MKRELVVTGRDLSSLVSSCLPEVATSVFSFVGETYSIKSIDFECIYKVGITCCFILNFVP